MIELENTPERILLRFRQKPRNKLGMVAWTVFICAAAAFGLSRLFADVSAGVVITILIGIAGVAAIAAILAVPFRSSIVTTFDKVAHHIHVETSREGAEDLTKELAFADVKHVRLFLQQAKGQRLETLSLVLSGGGQIILAEQRQNRDFSLKPFDRVLANIAETIRHETGLPADPLPTPVALIGKVIGVERE